MDLEEHFENMKLFNDQNADMPDGAFFALAENLHDWDIDDWVWFVEQCKIRKTYT